MSSPSKLLDSGRLAKSLEIQKSLTTLHSFGVFKLGGPVVYSVLPGQYAECGWWVGFGICKADTRAMLASQRCCWMAIRPNNNMRVEFAGTYKRDILLFLATLGSTGSLLCGAHRP